MGRAQRNKGAGYEREVLAYLSDRWGVKAARILGQARDGGADAFIAPFVLEMKRRKTLTTIEGWMQQCVAALPQYEGELIEPPVPIVICRADKGESMVLMRLSDFANVVVPNDFMEEG